MHEEINGRKKIQIDIQSLLQFIALAGSLVWFTLVQTNRITALETTQSGQDKAIDLLTQNLSKLTDIVNKNSIIIGRTEERLNSLQDKKR